MQALGALTLTLASIMLLSGVWCYFLSPVTEYTKHVDSYRYTLSIEGFASRSVAFHAEKDETIDVTVGFRVRIPPPPINPERINVRIFDPEGKLIWEDINVTSSHYRARAPKSGSYKIEVENLGAETISIPIYVTRTVRISTRPLEPLGQWLSLISLPIFGFGIWMI